MVYIPTFLQLPFFCRRVSVDFGPNVIYKMLHVTICQKTHPKIVYGSHSLILSTSRCKKIMNMDSFSKFRSCIAFLLTECISVYHG